MSLITTLLQSPPDPAAVTVATDMEGTLSDGVTWKGLRNYLIKVGREAEFKRFMRRRYHLIPLYYLGLSNKQNFRENWMVDLVALYADYTREEFEEVAEYVVEEMLWPNRHQAVIDELQAHQTAGRRVVICSGLLEPMLKRFAAKVGFEAIGTPLIFNGDTFTGRVQLPFTTDSQKVVQMTHFLPENGRLHAAYGDTSADIPFLTMSENPCAVHPDRGLRRHATQHNWRILE